MIEMQAVWLKDVFETSSAKIATMLFRPQYVKS